MLLVQLKDLEDVNPVNLQLSSKVSRFTLCPRCDDLFPPV
jgi:hypothetical protein